ncbi:hypothetical protein BH23PLA1_BH23PLA1_24530 [soil metagenome]
MFDLSRRLARTERAVNAVDPKALAHVESKMGILAWRLTLHGPRNEQERGALDLLTEAAGQHWPDRFRQSIADDPDPKHRIAHRTGRTDNISDRAARLLIERGRWDILEPYSRPASS